MEVLDRTTGVWAIVNAASEVVVMASGADAESFVGEWIARGFDAICLDPAEVHAA
jgi:hypothetical protein